MSEEKNLIHEPNTYQTPNIIVDYWISKLDEIEFKVLNVICRKTFGWHKRKDRISISQISKITGKCCNSVRKAIHRLLDFKLINSIQSKTKSGSNNPNSYEINMIQLNKKQEIDRGTPRAWSTPRQRSRVLHGRGDTKPTYPKPKVLKGNAPLPPIVDNSLDIEKKDLQKEVPFSINEKKEEKPKKLSVGSKERKFPRPREQEQKFQWLKSLNLDTNENTLSYWAHTYSMKQLRDSWSHLKWKIEGGYKPDSVGAVYIKIVQNEACPITDDCLTNKKIAQQFAHETKWHSLEIHDKFCFDEANHFNDLPYNMAALDFYDKLVKLWEFKTGKCYSQMHFSNDSLSNLQEKEQQYAY